MIANATINHFSDVWGPLSRVLGIGAEGVNLCLGDVVLHKAGKDALTITVKLRLGDIRDLSRGASFHKRFLFGRSGFSAVSHAGKA